MQALPAGGLSLFAKRNERSEWIYVELLQVNIYNLRYNQSINQSINQSVIGTIKGRVSTGHQVQSKEEAQVSPNTHAQKHTLARLLHQHLLCNHSTAAFRRTSVHALPLSFNKGS
jgi:hypothetical protein